MSNFSCYLYFGWSESDRICWAAAPSRSAKYLEEEKHISQREIGGYITPGIMLWRGIINTPDGGHKVKKGLFMKTWVLHRTWLFISGTKLGKMGVRKEGVIKRSWNLCRQGSCTKNTYVSELHQLLLSWYLDGSRLVLKWGYSQDLINNAW